MVAVKLITEKLLDWSQQSKWARIIRFTLFSREDEYKLSLDRLSRVQGLYENGDRRTFHGHRRR